MTKVTARLKTALADRYTRDSQKAVEYYDKVCGAVEGRE